MYKFAIDIYLNYSSGFAICCPRNLASSDNASWRRCNWL